MSIHIDIWPGSGSAITTSSNSTPWGLYDAEPAFQTDAPKFARWVAYRLGYPIQDVELNDTQFYTCYEEAVTEFSYQVNLFNAQSNMLRLQGSSTSTNITQKNVTPGMGGVLKLSEQYGQEVLVGGNVTLHKSYFVTTASVSTYDLYEVVSKSFADAGSGSIPERAGIEIKRVWHQAPPAIVRYFDPFAGTGMGTYSMLQEFGWTNYSVATSFMMLPIYADILRLQAIEFNDDVRRSAYGFEVINKEIRILPNPTTSFAIWFDWILTSDRNDPVSNAGGSNAVSGASDMSNVPYENMAYTTINSIGRQWIRDYGLSLAKATLGRVRAKYNSIPIPNNEVSLDGTDLLTQAQAEQVQLIEQLRTILEKSTRTAQLLKEAEEKEALQKTLSGIPLPIFIG